MQNYYNEWDVPVSFIVISGKTYPNLLIQTGLFEMDIEEYGINPYDFVRLTLVFSVD